MKTFALILFFGLASNANELKVEFGSSEAQNEKTFTEKSKDRGFISKAGKHVCSVQSKKNKFYVSCSVGEGKSMATMIAVCDGVSRSFILDQDETSFMVKATCNPEKT